jgi:hypothetical protein
MSALRLLPSQDNQDPKTAWRTDPQIQNLPPMRLARNDAGATSERALQAMLVAEGFIGRRSAVDRPILPRYSRPRDPYHINSEIVRMTR